MANVTILYEGYVKEGDEGDVVRNTACLVTDGRVKMIVDPGLVESPALLLDALKRQQLTPKDITHVYVTHYHMDHVRYVGLFDAARVIDYKYFYDGEVWGEHLGDGYQITDSIRILHTPGHTMDDSALLVQTTEGVVAISHVWWFPDRTPEEDPMASDQQLLEESRKRVEAAADWIITPHGGKLDVRGGK